MPGQSAAYSRYCTFVVRNNTYRRLLQKPNLSLLHSKRKSSRLQLSDKKKKLTKNDVFSLIKLHN